jgi:hypothetical protein
MRPGGMALPFLVGTECRMQQSSVAFVEKCPSGRSSRKTCPLRLSRGGLFRMPSCPEDEGSWQRIALGREKMLSVAYSTGLR